MYFQALRKALNVKDKDQCNKKESETTWSMQRLCQKKKTLKSSGVQRSASIK